MTPGGRLISLFPTFIVILDLAVLLWLAARLSAVALLSLVFVLYILPPLAFRLHNRLWPLVEGVSRLDEPRYSPWWASHQFQLIYGALPFLEAVLRIIPGFYSAWLRLWGSQVGRRVYWTPSIEIIDRSLLIIGDRVVFGHQVACCSHIIRMKDGALRLTVVRIRIGNGVFIGGASRLAPGAIIPDNAAVPAFTDIGINQTFGRSSRKGTSR